MTFTWDPKKDAVNRRKHAVGFGEAASVLEDPLSRTYPDPMKKGKRIKSNELLPEYDFSSMKGGVRGKYAARLRKESNLVLLEPDVASAFPTEAAANEALRAVLKASQAVRRRRPNRPIQRTAGGTGRR